MFTMQELRNLVEDAAVDVQLLSELNYPFHSPILIKLYATLSECTGLVSALCEIAAKDKAKSLVESLRQGPKEQR